jgi:hypothetical protein
MIPTEITFRGMSHASWLEADVLERVDRLRTYFDGITGCHVLIELANRHHETGNHYHVRIGLAVPGDEVVVSRDAGLHAPELKTETARSTRQSEARPERKHVKVAGRQAFDVARRRLQDYARKQRGAVKLHRASPVKPC